MSEELKPCPFCKSAAKLYNHYGSRRKYGWDVDCTGNKHCRGYGGGYIATRTKEEAIKAWNTRVDNAITEELKYRPDYAVTATDIIRDAIEAHGFAEPSKGYLENIVRVAFCLSESQKDETQTDLTLQDKLQSANTLIDTLVEALGFYADPSDYKAPMTGGLGKLYFDCGQAAKQALAEAKQWRAK